MELVDHQLAEALPHVQVPGGVRLERDLLHPLPFHLELLLESPLDEKHGYLQVMLLVNLFLNHGSIVELLIVQKEPLNGIPEDAFDISFLNILIHQRPKKVRI